MTVAVAGLVAVGCAPFLIAIGVLCLKYWKTAEHLSRQSTKRRMFS